MKKMIIVWAILILTGATTGLAGEGEGRIHLGKLGIMPKLEVQGVYDDNIYLGDGGDTPGEAEKGDWILHTVPTLVLDYRLPARGSIQLGYQGDWAWYRDHPENDWKAQRASLDLDYRAPGGLILDVDNLYADTEDPYGSENEYKLGLAQISRWTDDLKARIGYAFSERFRLLAYGNFFTQDYDAREDFTQDYRTLEFGLGSEMRLLAKTWGFVRYHHGGRDYFTHPSGSGVIEDNDADFDWHRINTGLTWDSGAKFSGEVNFGYTWKAHDNRTDAQGQAFEDRDTWIAATAVSYEIGPAVSAALRVHRALRMEGADSRESYMETGAGLGFRKELFSRVSVDLQAGYVQNDYDFSSREDEKWSLDLKLAYDLKDWLKVEAGWSRAQKESSMDDFDYTDNRYEVGMQFRF